VKSWNNPYARIDGRADYVDVFRDRDRLFSEAFGRLAREVFDPLRAAERKA